MSKGLFVLIFTVTRNKYTDLKTMTDFPKGGNVDATRDWLDKKGFMSFFVGWEADAISGLERSDITTMVPGENGLKLWGFLNTA